MSKFNLKTFIKRNASTILTIAATGGIIGTTVTAIKATSKNETLFTADMTKKERLKRALKVYTPTIIFATSTIACIVGSNSINKNLQASLTSAYALIDQSYKKYKNKLIELEGPDLDKRIKDEIMKDTVKCIPPKLDINDPFFGQADELDYFEGKDAVIFYDPYSDRYFESTAYKVKNAEYHLNRNFAQSGCCDLNEFYDFLGIEPTDYGNAVGWTMESGYSSIDFIHRRVDLDDSFFGADTEICVIEYLYAPDSSYTNYDQNYFNE